MGRPRKPSTLTKRLEPSRRASAPASPLVEQPQAAFKPEAGLDSFDLHNGILDHLGFDRLLGSASEHIMEARLATGAIRDDKIQRAIRYLQRALPQAVAS